jgi:hypothetical protein
MLIAFAGKKFAGKDTAAEILIKKHGFISIRLADSLKDMCSSCFVVKREDMDDPKLKESPFTKPIIINNNHVNLLLLRLKYLGIEVTEQQEEQLRKFIGTELVSIRNLLQFVGTDMIRTHIDDNIWLKLFDKKLKELQHDNIIVTDARFKNERDHLRNMGAILCYVHRPNNESVDSHKSENELGHHSDYDVLIINDKDIATLHFDISQWYSIRRNI